MKDNIEKQIISTIVKESKKFQTEKIVKSNFNQLKIEPLAINFYNVNPEDTYKSKIKITNITNKILTLIVSIPKNITFLLLEHEYFGKLSPGLSKEFQVIYKCKQESHIFQDFVSISTKSGFNYNLPINSKNKDPLIIYPPIFDLGFISTNEIFRKSFFIKNNGQEAIEIFIEKNQNLQQYQILNTMPLFLKPNRKKEIIIQVFSKTSGLINNEWIIRRKQYEILPKIRIIGTILNSYIDILDEKGNTLNNYNFGNILYGQKKQLIFYIVNNQSNNLNFNINTIFSNHENLLKENLKTQTPNEFGIDKCQNIVEINPKEYVLGPFKTKKITLDLKSSINDEIIHNVENLMISPNAEPIKRNIFAIVDIKLDNLFHQIKLKAIYKSPLIKLSEIEFFFGNISKGQTKIELLEIESKEINNNILIEFQDNSQFNTNIKKFILKPSMKKRVELMFIPKNLGNFWMNIVLIVNKDFKVNILCDGSCITKIPKVKSKNFKLPKLNSQISDFTSSNRLFKKTEINSSTNKIISVSRKKLFRTERASNKLIVKKEKNMNDFLVNSNYNPNPNIPGKIYEYNFNNKKYFKQSKLLLNPEQLRNIWIGPKEIDFNTVNVYSNNIKYFKIKNENSIAISANIIFSIDELKESNNKTKIIPPDYEITFPIILISKKVQTINIWVRYILNEKHEFFFRLKADVIPVQIIPNKNLIKFLFSDDIIELENIENLSLSNYGNSIANFSCYCTGEYFDVNLKEGKINSGESINLKLSYKPNKEGNIHEEKLIIKPEHGNKKEIKLIGYVNEVKSRLNVETINFNSISVAQKYTKNFKIINESVRFCLIFNIEELPQEFRDIFIITPNKGKILPNSEEKIEINIRSNKKLIIKDYNLKINIRGLESKIINLNAEIVIPEIEVIPRNFDLKDIYYGNSITKNFKIYNHSNIPAQTQIKIINLFKNQVSIEKSNKNCKIHIFEKEILEEKNQEDSSSENYTEMNSENEEDEGYSDENKSESNDYFSTKTSKMIIISLTPKSEIELKLTFTPIQSDKDYDFIIPISLEGYQDKQNYNLRVKCNCLAPLFYFEPENAIIDFDKISESNFTNIKPITKQFIIKNINHPENIQYELLNFKKEIYNDLEVFNSSGVIKPNSLGIIEFIFYPKKYCFFNDKYSLRLKQSGKKKIVNLFIKAEVVSPSIYFKVKEIILPSAPLGIISKTYFKIYNDGYMSTGLKLKLDEEFENSDKINLKLEFVRDNRLAINIEELKIKVEFSSNIPISFTKILEVRDDIDKVYKIAISGTSDNYFLTNLFFFNKYSDSLDINLKSNELNMGYNKFKNSLSNLKENKKSVISDRNIEYIDFLKLNGEVLKDWINNQNICPLIYNYPTDIIESGGSQIYSLLENLLGKNNIVVKTKKHISFDLSTNDKIQLLLSQYTSLFYELKLDGLLINILRPEFLFNLIDLNNFYRNYPNKLFRISKISEHNYIIKSLESWNTLILQIIKVYIVSKIKTIDLKSIIKNYERKEEMNLDIINSNFLSSKELNFLKWIEIINIGQDNKPINFRIYSFDDYFLDYNLIYNIFWFYNPFLKEKYSEIDFSTLKIISSLFGLNYFHKLEEYGPYELETYLTIMELYINLPNFLNFENIYFECGLNEIVTKNIQINNNSINTAFFDAIIYSENNDFKIENDLIKVDPKSNSIVPISFHSRLSLPITANLILIPKNKTGIFIKPLIFRLISIVNKIKEFETIEINDVKLYTNKIVDLNLKNPFSKDCSFETKLIYIQNEKNLLIKPYILTLNSINVLKSSNFIYKLNYLPIQFKETKVYLSFLDKEVGEYVVLIIGKPDYPEPNIIYLNYELEKTNALNYKLEFQNKNLVDALENYKNYYKSDIQVINDATNFIIKSKNKSNIFKASIGDKAILKINKKIRLIQNKDNYLNFTCSSIKPMIDYKTVVLLENNNKYDIRVFFVNFSIIPKILKANIELKTALNTLIDQNIPIYNSCNKNAMFKSQLFDINNNIYEEDIFRLEGPIQIPAYETKKFNIKYIPILFEKSNAIIKIKNKNSGEIFKFNILGIPLPPYAKENIEYEVKINVESNFSINIDNKTDKIINYKVACKCTILNFPENILLKPYSNNIWNFKILSKNKGKIVKKLKLINIDNEKEFIWYVLIINTIGDNLIYKESITTDVRKLKTIKLEFINNTKYKSEYFVENNNKDLQGLKKFYLEPNSKYTYELNFLPLTLYENLEAIIYFKSNYLGEKIYNINLKSLKPKNIIVPEVNSVIGFKKGFHISIKNLSFKKELNCKLDLIGSKSFWVNINQEIKVKPNEAYKIYLEFAPIINDAIEEAELIVIPENQAKWNFNLKGKGNISKEVIKNIDIKGELNTQNISSINYKNPFHEDIRIESFITYNNKEDEEILKFNNGKKSQKLLIKSQETINLNILFIPLDINQYKFNLFIKVLDSFYLKYNINGISSKTVIKELETLSIISGKVLEKTLKIKLEGLSKNLDKNYSINYEIESENNIIKKLCNIYGISLNENYLSMIVKFSPFKPINCKAYLNIYFKNTGVWRFPIKFEAKLPELYTELIIYGTPSEPGKVMYPFKGFDSKKEKHYKCYLTPNSSPEFSVSPESGSIYPYKNINIKIKYNCLDYRDNREAELRIETIYNLIRIKIIGKIPKYIPPKK